MFLLPQTSAALAGNHHHVHRRRNIVDLRQRIVLREGVLVLLVGQLRRLARGVLDGQALEDGGGVRAQVTLRLLGTTLVLVAERRCHVAADC